MEGVLRQEDRVEGGERALAAVKTANDVSSPSPSPSCLAYCAKANACGM